MTEMSKLTNMQIRATIERLEAGIRQDEAGARASTAPCANAAGSSPTIRQNAPNARPREQIHGLTSCRALGTGIEDA